MGEGGAETLVEAEMNYKVQLNTHTLSHLEMPRNIVAVQIAVKVLANISTAYNRLHCGTAWEIPENIRTVMPYIHCE